MSTPRSTLLQDTLAVAESVLTTVHDVDLQITAIDAYVASFTRVLALLESGGKHDFSRDDLERLEAMHQQVLTVATGLLGDTSGSLRQLQSKGKAILAYTDTLPKRVSIRGKKSG